MPSNNVFKKTRQAGRLVGNPPYANYNPFYNLHLTLQ